MEKKDMAGVRAKLEALHRRKKKRGPHSYGAKMEMSGEGKKSKS